MPTERACRFEQDGNLLVITLLPELAEVPWADVEEIGGSLEGRVRDRQKPQVVVDLTPLAHMGSGMVALVVRIWKAAQEKGGKMVVVNDHELVLEVLQLAGLTNRWTIVTTREEARKNLDARGGGRAAAPASPGAAARSDRTGLLLAGGGLLAVLASVSGLVLLFLAPDALPEAAVKALLFGGAFAGTILGTLALAWYVGVPRLAGVAVLVCSVALGVAGLVLTTGGDADAAPAAAPGDDLAVDPDELLDPDGDAGRVGLDPPAGRRAGGTFADDDFDGDDSVDPPDRARPVAAGSGLGAGAAPTVDPQIGRAAPLAPADAPFGGDPVGGEAVGGRPTDRLDDLD